MTEQSLATRPEDQLGMLAEDQLAQLITHANIFWKSGLCPAKFDNPEAIIITAMYGREIGLSFMQALTDVHVINGVPGLSASGQSAVIRSKLPKAKIKILEQNEMVCRISMWRPGMDDPQEFSYTIEEADRANLTGKDNWRNHPTDMLTARCLTRGYRFVFKDILGSFSYTPEEIYSIPKPNKALPNFAPAGGIPKVKPEEAEAAAGIPDEDKAAPNTPHLAILQADLEEQTSPPNVDLIYDQFRTEHINQPSTLLEAYDIYLKRKKELQSPLPSEVTQAELIPEEESNVE